jgi:anti-sigma regulatory factor (Ser/Thr protein kinase)
VAARLWAATRRPGAEKTIGLKSWIRWNPFGMRHFETLVEPALTALAPLRYSLDAWLEGGGMSEPPRAAVVLATHEAVANAIQHAGVPGPVSVRGDSDADGVVIEVSDDGRWKRPDDPPSEERGRGLKLIRSLVSDAQIRTGEGGTTVRIHQYA